ncbi:MAG: VCBS repeat-containing protein [candidate division Zixibacteria bacterium]|nr:VCBS repeat-containing protein [candidate division Zixibacteria bacterium]MDH3936061.1 VCBS repeat-containing protein [candidate division Zixibacteria bacterium]MDH4033551.1 VCBS repeat-containing protein [candidate division Zixibacteria bacterium]
MRIRTVFSCLSMTALVALSLSSVVEGRTDYDIAGSATALIAVDLDGDSALDIAAADGSSGAVAILFNNGDGSFQTPVYIATAPGTNSIAAGYLNPDSFVDLAVTNSSDGSVSILYGNGDGSFQPVQTIVTLESPHSIVIADFYLDGRPDLAFAAGNVATSCLCLRFNDNLGSFEANAQYALDTDALEVLAGDFNGDDTVDVAVLHRHYWGGIPSHDPVWIRLGNGNGSFQDATYPPGLMMASTMAVADIDSDTDQDLVVGVDDWDVCMGAMLTLENDGSASFSTGVIGAFFWDQARSLTPVDFNNDGGMDYLVALTCDTIGRINLYMNYFDTTLYEPIKLVDANYASYDVIAADLDNDGDFDIASANGDIAVFETQKTGDPCCRGIRGNIDYDANDQINIADIVALVDYMFTGGPNPPCTGEANVNGDGVGESEPWDINDLIYLIDYMFGGGPPPPHCVIFDE